MNEVLDDCDTIGKDIQRFFRNVSGETHKCECCLSFALQIGSVLPVEVNPLGKNI
jgi:hypothetical protein